MKKIWITALVLLLFVVGAGIALTAIDWNRLGAESYYVKITEDGKEFEDRVSPTEVYKRYEYSFEGYNADGEAKTLAFTSHKNLRHGAYLEIFYKGKKGVTSYEERPETEVPEKAKEQLNS